MLFSKSLTWGKVPLLLCSSLFLFSCSLNYGNEDENDTSYPEFSFYGAKLVRYENAKQTLDMSAERIEKYRGSNATYAKNAEFSTWNDNGEKETEGKCTLLKADSDTKQYTLLDGITLKSFSESFEIEASSLFYDGKEEQLISGKDSLVVLTRDDLQMEGREFSASGIDKSFSFSASIDGVITTKSESDNREKENEEK